MWMRWSASLALSLSLLLASLAGLAGHEHRGPAEGGTYVCAVDHQVEPGARPRGHGSELRAGGEPHRHHCPVCHYSSNRIAPAAARVVAGADLGGEEPVEIRSPARAVAPWGGLTVRGPPSA